MNYENSEQCATSVRDEQGYDYDWSYRVYRDQRYS